jgi:hypothetical protein
VLADNKLGPAELALDRFDRVAQVRPQLRRRAQLDDRCAAGTTGAQITNVGWLVHWTAPVSLRSIKLGLPNAAFAPLTPNKDVQIPAAVFNADQPKNMR